MFMLLKLSSRNLLRNLRRTTLTVGSIAFGLAVILWMQCVLESRNRELIDTVTSTYTGHLMLSRSDFRRDRFVQDQMTEIPADFLNALPPGSVWAKRVHFGSLISSAEQASPVDLLGIEPEHEAQITKIKESLKAGEFLSDDPSPLCESRQIYLGKPLAERLKVGVGSKVVLMGQAADGTLGNDMFRVRGIFETGSPDFDKGLVYTPINCARKIAAINGFHELVIRLPNDSVTLPLQAVLAKRIPKGLDLITWRQALPRMNTVIVYNDASLILVSVLLFVVMIFGVMNTIFMSVFERTREFGVMIALGMEPRKIQTLLLLESLLIGTTASVLGTALGVAAVVYHHFRGFDISPLVGNFAGVDQFHLDLVLFPNLALGPFLKYLAIANLLVVVASILPSYRASRLNPIDTIRAV